MRNFNSVLTDNARVCVFFLILSAQPIHFEWLAKEQKTDKIVVLFRFVTL